MEQSSIPSNKLAIVGQKVKLFPELSAASLKAGLSHDLITWSVLRATNSRGSGYLPLTAAVMGLQQCGYNRSSAYRRLAAGSGKLWHIEERPQLHAPAIKWVVILGLQRVCELLDVQYLTRPVEMSAADFSRNPKAALYASTFHVEGVAANPISRLSITDKTGLPRRSQQRLEKTARVKRTANFAFYEDGQPQIMTVEGKSRLWTMMRRLGNTYHSTGFQTTPRGLSKKVSRSLGKGFELSEAPNQDRSYHRSAKKALKSSSKTDEVYLLSHRSRRMIPGRQEWNLI